MKRKSGLMASMKLGLVALSMVACTTQSKELAEKETTLKVFEPNWESIKANYKDPEWFNDQKFGIFIHWGAYSVPAFGSEWYPRLMYMDTATFSAQLNPGEQGPNKVYLHHKETWGDQKEFGYKDFIPMFKGENFNADEWIDLFKSAGARYVIPVADHHDGFAMYKSNTTRWNAYDMGPKRDVLGELFTAGRAKDMIMGASSHFAFNWSFYNKKDKFDTVDPEYADLYSSKGQDLEEPVSDKFKQRWWERTKDVIDNYQPDIFWLDFYVDIPDFAEMRPKLAAYYYNKGIEWDKEVVLQDKNFSHEAFPEGTVIYDLERGKLPGIRNLPWQTDTSIGKNSWSYVTNWESKTTNELVDDLVDIVSKNGNLLLNVGPKSDGTIPEDQKNILLEIGEWLKVNGEAIYETKYWDTFGEGPTEVAKGHHSEGNNKGMSAEDIRFTTKEGKLYAIAMDWPENGQIVIKSLAKGAEFAPDKLGDIRLLGSDEELSWEQTNEGLIVKLPAQKVGDFAHTLAISI
ncbi:alpha-L-fucosidase [Reichenbachiella agarivorans]|uniref:alpha-L-fucosidase n=1 Tax=Reichenbachiella agarivorans TaxID=2979464 RepID=A0ABY6CNF5_9BACT|nr:alpha-L-fucosidase [Reichenbachiella agarivorans]UXP32051.1 alpha-L-fucosidase [Reichenbachiella agarivorans]